jgi:hypothetical protein
VAGSPRVRPRPPAVRRRAAAGGGAAAAGKSSPRWLLPALALVVAAFALSIAWRWWGPGRAADGPRRPQAAAFSGAPVRIEVVNGSGEPGAAAKLASYLREGGFNVVLVGSADRYDYVRTLVVDRGGDERAAAAVAAYLGPVQRVRQRARSEADVTVVVGRDRGRVPWGEGRSPKGRG